MKNTWLSARPTHLTWVILILASALWAPSTLAWNATGHRVIAVLAWDQLSDPTRKQISSLLEDHPALPDWQQQLSRGKNPPPITPLARFAEASTWADDIRHDERYADDTRDAMKLRHRDWHYVNWASQTGAPKHRGGRLDVEIPRLTTVLADRAQAPEVRAMALVWLIHLVGDAHQPLHVISWQEPDGDFDDGGLNFHVLDESRPRFSQMSLHSWWDDLPGPPWLRGDRLRARAEEVAEGRTSHKVAPGNPQAWLEESFALANREIRPILSDSHRNSADNPWRITPEYRSLAKKVSERRLHEAGIRLARLLNDALSP